MTLTASACSKIILLGEHAVVYGKPAIAVPLSAVRAYVTAVPAAHFSIVARDLANQALLAADASHPFVKLMTAISVDLQQSLPAMTFEIVSQIPIASGLGSGAAIATALARALYTLYDQPVTLEHLNQCVYETEKYYHGTPSGIDNTVIVYEKPIRFLRDQPIDIITDFQRFHLLVASTGIEAPTRESVGDVRQLYTHDPATYGAIFDKIGELAQTGLLAMQAGDTGALGRAMDENHELLRTMTVSAPALDTLVTTARTAGALGAKLSGSGRGGNMIALVTAATRDSVEQTLRRAGAVWTKTVEVAP